MLASPVSGGPLSLRETLQRARHQALAVAAARARVGEAEARVRQARGFRLPSVSLQETYLRTDSPAEAFALQLNQERFSFNDFVASDPNNPATLEAGITRLELRLPLYTGGELSARIGQAEHATDAAQARLARTMDEAAVAAGEAFVMLAQAREYAALLERAVATVEAHVDAAEAYVEQGMIVSSELLRARVELARVEDMRLEAEGRARVASANLSFRLSEDQGVRWELENLPAPHAPAGSVAEWLERARGRADLEAARALLRAGELEETVRRAAFLPRVGVMARGELNDDRPFGDHGRSTAVLAFASIDLFAGGSHRAALAAARWSVEAARAGVQRFEEGVLLEVRQAYAEVETALARHETAAEAVKAAREAERITRERFASGVAKMIDLLDASTALREAETRELASRAEATAALLRLALASGQAPESVIE